MSEMAGGIEEGARALDARVDDILATHGGDARAAIEVLLLVSDARARSISRGYVRGLLPGRQLAGDGHRWPAYPPGENSMAAPEPEEA
ncbi:hypothetical protein OSH08_08665 [Kaistia geumhonensis]|uniref:Uncharacterized protein n=1 Tax=Kaistia geumhonensis TaxID=410839 RepID=A0ABU0M426_9HYPH|nr:hypothetical protein [Kaistia geumhonensis]MCX5479075.1 hypothetical protein [Kaistia geumhonensis]MDQ0515705.1 hypothetical protein [Kaistia geumhonensis]